MGVQGDGWALRLILDRHAALAMTKRGSSSLRWRSDATLQGKRTHSASYDGAPRGAAIAIMGLGASDGGLKPTLRVSW